MRRYRLQVSSVLSVARSRKPGRSVVAHAVVPGSINVEKDESTNTLGTMGFKPVKVNGMCFANIRAKTYSTVLL